ncbi:MAG TPA: trypsin-like peptidase domain-containing protein [Candidatus Angelobacter sp.]|jgi:S1-C subfamily serine protease|nr:trypsin-like peptidase domain-containing protein [Candidatus Angelobacter sp.]
MAQSIWKALSNEFTEAASNLGNSVVALHGRGHATSGILWSKDSVVTASHALRRDEEITVIVSPGSKALGRVAGRDAGTDLALVRLQEQVDAPTVRWGDTSALQIGELVLALGRSWRGNVVASSGVISGLMGSWRTWRGGRLEQFIRPDLVMYPGFSGGPLISSQGSILGLNTTGLHRSGITVPSATVTRVVAELLEKGSVTRPYLGLSMQAAPLPESLRSKLNLMASEGLVVLYVESGGPADKAGVLLGDVLFELEGKSVSDTESVQDILGGATVGKSLQARFIRAGSVTVVNIEVGTRK